MFLNEMNRIYEIIHPLAFQTRYNSWWISQENNDFQTVVSSPGDDCDFGLLIIRMCLLSCQCLPHPKYPTKGVVHTHLSELEEWLYATADQIDTARAPHPPSTITVQQRFFNVCYLKNYAKIREAWSVLSAAIKDAHEVGLHLKDPGIIISELDLEYRRRTFWSLYVWDRFMSSFFGHWPLIPEGYFDIDLPHDNLQAYTVSPYILTPFTSRVVHIKLARYMTAFMSPPSWRSDQLDPIVVADFSQRFQEVILDQLPPAFWLDNADTTWDAVDPTITGKRSLLHMFVVSTKAALYKAFADPCNNLRQPKDGRPNYRGDLLALSHRRSLMKETCGVISSIHKLYMLPPDERSEAGDNLFLFPTFMTEALTCLGVCLLSIQADRDILAANGIQVSSDPGLQYSYAAFFNGYNVICQQAPRYALARKAMRIMEGFHGTVRATACNQYPDIVEVDYAPGTLTAAGTVGSVNVFQLEHALVSMYSQGGEKVTSNTNLPLPSWLPSFLDSPARSWVFQNGAFFRDLLA
ncbi:hypothetical protein N7495_005720 [Penicillium taxi]|uniref:uncharacterized protein n=1 Tax=Penicillium taxi TaxID=168475 RepID=UPI002545671C|nr:uncharacterized protein N7495_005720 [Penicillium taxi]KAJ5894029.1 hypothetical protein N7495_005720 [Penicillium taxi]